MVTEEEILYLKSKQKENVKTTYQVTAKELNHFFDDETTLAELIGDRKKQYEKENKFSATEAYLDIEEKCQISTDTYKKAMCGNRKITRTFLYKFVVGFKMSLEEANEYFCLCGGPLSKNNVEDYICINALRDRDDIQQLVNDFEKHLDLKIGYKSK